MVPPDDGSPGAVPTPPAGDAVGIVDVGRRRRSVPFLSLPGAAPRTRSEGASWFGFAVLGFVVGQIAGYLLAVAAAAVAHANLTRVAELAAPPEWYVVSSLVGIWIGFAGAPVLASLRAGTGRVLDDLGVRFRWIDLLGLAIGPASQLVISILYLPFRSHLHDYGAPVTKLTGSAHGSGFLLIAVLTVTLVPFFEECFFRGLLFKGLARMCTPEDGRPGAGRAWGVVGAVVADGVLFGLAHGELEQLAGLALFGALLAAISYRTNRLGMTMLSHASFNLVVVISLIHTNATVVPAWR